MSKHKDNPERLLAAIYQTAEAEIQCDMAHQLIARCADALAREAALPQAHPQLWQHLQLCADCAAEYALTLELAHLESAGELARPAKIPPVPALEPERSFWERVTRVFQVAFPGFAPAAWAAVRSGGPLPPEPAYIALGEATLSLDVVANADDPALRDLLLTLEAADVEGTPLALQVGDATGPVVQEQVCDALGDACFHSLPPGDYTVRVLWRGSEYRVPEIRVP